MTVVGQAFGAGRKEEAKYYIIKLTGYAEIVLIISCAVTFLVSRPVMRLAGMEAGSMELCYQMLIAITIANRFCGHCRSFRHMDSGQRGM